MHQPLERRVHGEVGAAELRLRRTRCARRAAWRAPTSAPSKSGPGPPRRRRRPRPQLPVRPDQAEPHHRPERPSPASRLGVRRSRERTQRSRWKKNVSPTHARAGAARVRASGPARAAAAPGTLVEQVEDGAPSPGRACRRRRSRGAARSSGSSAVVLGALRLLEREGQALPDESARATLIVDGVTRRSVERDPRRHRESQSSGCEPEVRMAKRVDWYYHRNG